MAVRLVRVVLLALYAAENRGVQKNSQYGFFYFLQIRIVAGPVRPAQQVLAQ